MSTRTRLVVCADDLTGANDIGVQFAKRGIGSVVLIEGEGEALPEGYQVVVVNTESRHLSPEAAAERVRRWVTRGRGSGAQYFYKKTDSTLRGNVGAELQALLEASGVKVLPFMPALPELGRTTRQGMHYVHGQPLHKTEFARDPRNPITASSVKEILRRQCTVPVHSVWVPDLISGGHEGIVVIDATSVEQVERVASALAGRGMLGVCAGAAGFGKELAKLLEFDHGGPFVVRCRGPVLMVNGSLNERSLRQISKIERSVNKFRMGPEFLLEAAPALPEIECEGDLLLYSVSERGELDWFLEQGKGLSRAEAHERVARNTGALVKDLLGRGKFGTLVVFGGDTLMGIARANGWKAFTPLREVVDGVTVSRPENEGVVVISKAGGFGEEDTLEKILEFVRERSG